MTDLVRNRLYRLARAGDFGDASGAAACYVDDGAFSIEGLPAEFGGASTTRGREALAAMYRGIYAANLGHARHWIANTEITSVIEQSVRADSYFMLLRAGEVPSVGILFSGTYQDTFRLTGEGWLIEQRRCVVDPHAQHRAMEPTDAYIREFDKHVRGTDEI